MDLILRKNPNMDTTQIISSNLASWMESTPALDTIKKLASKANVGFGTAQRARNGTGNITIQNLEQIAKAFGKTPIDLLQQTRQDIRYLKVAEPPLPTFLETKDTPIVAEITELARSLDDIGKGMLLSKARDIADERKASRRANKA